LAMWPLLFQRPLVATAGLCVVWSGWSRARAKPPTKNIALNGRLAAGSLQRIVLQALLNRDFRLYTQIFEGARRKSTDVALDRQRSIARKNASLPIEANRKSGHMKYSNAQITYHWLSAALIFVMLGTGLAYSYELADAGIMTVHQWAGQGLIMVLVVRIIVRLSRNAPVNHTLHSAWEDMLARIVQAGLYLCMIAFVITGYVSASAEIDNVLIAPVSLAFARSDIGELLLEAHYMAKWVLLALLLFHIAGALKHAIWDKDNTLSNMTYHSKRTPL